MTRPLEQARELARTHSHLAKSDLDALWAIAYALIALVEQLDKASGLPRQKEKEK